VRMRQKANAVSASLSSASTSSGARTEGIGGTGDKRRRGYFAAGVGSLILNVHKGTFGFSCAQFTSDYLLAPDTRPSPRLPVSSLSPSPPSPRPSPPPLT